MFRHPLGQPGPEGGEQGRGGVVERGDAARGATQDVGAFQGGDQEGGQIGGLG